jgi:hypothetical protein
MGQRLSFRESSVKINIMTLKIVQNDTLPVINATIVDQDGNAVDLTSATVKFYMVNSETGVAKIDGHLCSIISAVDGTVRFSWESTDTDVVGNYLGEFEVTFPSGKIQTGFKQISIVIRNDI